MNHITPGRCPPGPVWAGIHELTTRAGPGAGSESRRGGKARICAHDNV